MMLVRNNLDLNLVQKMKAKKVVIVAKQVKVVRMIVKEPNTNIKTITNGKTKKKSHTILEAQLKIVNN